MTQKRKQKPQQQKKRPRRDDKTIEKIIWDAIFLRKDAKSIMDSARERPLFEKRKPEDEPEIWYGMEDRTEEQPEEQPEEEEHAEAEAPEEDEQSDDENRTVKEEEEDEDEDDEPAFIKNRTDDFKTVGSRNWKRELIAEYKIIQMNPAFAIISRRKQMKEENERKITQKALAFKALIENFFQRASGFPANSERDRMISVLSSMKAYYLKKLPSNVSQPSLKMKAGRKKKKGKKP